MRGGAAAERSSKLQRQRMQTTRMLSKTGIAPLGPPTDT